MGKLDDDHDRDVASTSRRSYLGALAGVAGTPLLASLASADDENVLTITGRGTTAHYEFSVSVDVEKSTAHDGTINPFDQIEGTRVTGRTTREPDSFAFTGEVTEFETSASVEVLLNGDPIDLATPDISGRVLTITGRGETAHYEFTVSGDVEKSTAHDGTINPFDQIEGTRVTGRTTREPDSFVFTGEITEFEASAPVDVSIDGEPTERPDSEEREDDSDDEPEDEIDESDYSNVVDIVDAGADNSGDESIRSVLERVADDDTLVRFPDGEYLMDGTLRITDYDRFAMVGDDATITVAPTNGYVFKLGTYRSPIDDLRVEGFTVDISGDDTGGRVFELQANDSLEVRDIDIEGKHDTPSRGPMLVGLQTSDGEGLVENVSMPDGGAEVSGGRGGTGLLVSHFHEGTVTLRNITIGPFPDNGIYCSGTDGTVQVEGGLFENTNVAGVRLKGDDSYIDGSEFVYDEDIDGFGGQRPIRLDDGDDLVIRNVDIEMSIDQTEAIRVMPGVDSASIHDVEMDLSSEVRDGIAITSGAGPVETDDIDVNGNSRYDVFEY